MRNFKAAVFLFLATCVAAASAISECGPFPIGRGRNVMRFYVWDVSVPYSDQAVTVVPFPGRDGQSTFGFGSGVAIYNKLTALPIYNSTECGRNEGFAIASSLDLTTVSLVLNHKFQGIQGYIGSSGLFNSSTDFNEIPIVGGVGAFASANGVFRTWIIRKYGPGNANNFIRAEIEY